jgi:hypothetical protein
VGAWSLKKDLLHVINDGLMAIFFFVVGLEIKREVVAGELREFRKASLPTVAKLRYRRVKRKAAISGWRPFRVLSPTLATTSSTASRLKVSVSLRRATHLRHARVVVPSQFRPKLSVVSLSRAVQVIGCCERLISPIQHGYERWGGPNLPTDVEWFSRV